MSRLTPCLAAAAVLIATGVAHGIAAGRWSGSAELQAAAARLSAVPDEFSGWSTAGTSTISDAELKIGEISGYVSRTYRRTDGAAVQVVLVCGRSGPIGVHTPDICFRGAGYRQLGPLRDVGIGSGGIEHHFKIGEFGRPDAASAQVVKTFWAWSLGDGAWTAPEAPRVAFAGEPFLYKLYVTDASPTAGGPADGTSGVGERFLADFLPVLETALVSSGD